MTTQGNCYKIVATAIIWGFSTVIMAICIPLVKTTNSGVLLPLIVILGASETTIVVWRNFSERNRKISELTNSISKLDERISNLEIISSIDELDIENKLKELEFKK